LGSPLRGMRLYTPWGQRPLSEFAHNAMRIGAHARNSSFSYTWQPMNSKNEFQALASILQKNIANPWRASSTEHTSSNGQTADDELFLSSAYIPMPMRPEMGITKNEFLAIAAILPNWLFALQKSFLAAFTEPLPPPSVFKSQCSHQLSRPWWN
jgi:hypothetical protein